MIALLLACAGQTEAPEVAAPRMVASVPSRKVPADGSVELTLTAEAPPEWAVTAGEATSDELEITAQDEEAPTSDGRRSVHTRHYTLSGAAGSYVVQFTPGTAEAPDGATQQLEAPPLFIDIGVEGPTGGPMAGLLDAPPPEPPPWGLIAAVGAGAVGVALAGAWLWRRSQQPPPPPEPDPPHVAARKAWDKARTAAFEDQEQAHALSVVLRRYLEAILAYPATARTTREILAHIEDMGAMDVEHRGRARHILDATDRLKFAREGGGQGFFEALDEDFAAILAHTRPHPEDADA